jgi:predicted AlkP superfamily pyrophosphatase or phosphodiesterase
MRLIALAFIALITCCNLRAERLAGHVFVISLDGGKPAVIAESEMPVLKKLVADGAVTWAAQTIFPSKTLPSHTSMLTGLGPAKHHVLWNNFEPQRGQVLAPTIFTLARKTDPQFSTAMFVGKMKFHHLWQTGSLDVFDFKGPQTETPKAAGASEAALEIEKSVNPAQTVARSAAAYIAEKKPDLCFIHFPDPDSAGHKSGWGSPEQKEAFKVTDQALGQIIRALETSGIADQSVIIISADHGGHDKTHGDNIPDDMNIPWIAWGKGVKKGFTITQPVTTYDTAATALWLLGVPIPAEFDGKPVTQAFTGS